MKHLSDSPTILLALLYYFPLQLLVAGIVARSLYILVSRWIYAKVKCDVDGLFKEPPRKEYCPICFLRLPSLAHRYMGCCGKIVCGGCTYAVAIMDKEQKCPFCRTPSPAATSNEEIIKRIMKRVEANDAQAMCELGCCYSKGKHGLPQDDTKAIDLWHQAGELGCATAYNNVGIAYDNGEGVKMNKKKARHYYELAAMRGDVGARHNLGILENKFGNIDTAIKHFLIAVGLGGNMERALKHFMIAAEYGCDKSLVQIKQFFMTGYATKDDYEKALRAYQAYLAEIKSDDRDKAAAFSEDFKYYEL